MNIYKKKISNNKANLKAIACQLILVSLVLATTSQVTAANTSALALGKAKLQGGQFQAAIHLLETAVTKDPTNCEAHLCLGKAYSKVKDFSKARTQFRSAIRIGHGSASAQEANKCMLTMPRQFTAPKFGPGTRIIASALGIGGHVRGAEPGTEKPTIIEFYAKWCHPCQLQQPEIDKLKVTYADKVNFVAVNVDDPNSEQIIDQYSVSPIPTIIYLNKDGEVVNYTIGYSGESSLTKGIVKILGQS